MSIDSYTPADIDIIQSALARPLAEVYQSALAAQFVGSTTEDWLVVRRLLERGWTLPMVLEAIAGARDGEGDGLREVGQIAAGFGDVEGLSPCFPPKNISTT